jgi:putative hemolysin
MRTIRAMVVAALMMILLGSAISALGQNAKAKTEKPTNTGTGQAYCVNTGGVVEMRRAAYGTNNPQQDWLELDGVEYFCQYTLASDGSRIHLSLDTLFATKPTLAALAYYSLTQWNGQGNGNPASFYCTQLGGSEIGATSAAGGGWVEFGTIDEVLEACVFPDNSTVDSWGLLYHSAGITRGIDLSTVLRYKNPYTEKK